MPPKLTTEQMYKRFPDMAPGQTARGNKENYAFICAKRHGEYWQQYSNHFKSGCPKCGIENIAKNRRLTTEQMYKRFPDMAPGQTARGYIKKYPFICAKGHGEYWQRYDHRVIGRVACPRCQTTPPEPFTPLPELMLSERSIKPNFNFLKVSIIYAPNTQTLSK